jgi:hypothetical protein
LDGYAADAFSVPDAQPGHADTVTHGYADSDPGPRNADSDPDSVAHPNSDPFVQLRGKAARESAVLRLPNTDVPRHWGKVCRPSANANADTITVAVFHLGDQIYV